MICAINGVAVGVASEFALQSDIRIAAESARFGQVFVLRGIIPDTGAGTYLLPRLVGIANACELIFSGKIIDAQEMLRIGLVSRVVPDEGLIPTAKVMDAGVLHRARSGYRLSIAGRTTPTSTRRAVCFGQSSRNTAKKSPGPT